MRAQVNRVVVVLLLLVALPHVTVSERMRRGAGRRAALRWIKLGARLTGVEFDSHGTEQLRNEGLQFLLPNHSSPLDIAAMLAVHPDSCFVAGADLFRVPLLAGAMRSLGPVPVDRRSRQETRLPQSMRASRPRWSSFPKAQLPHKEVGCRSVG